MRRLILLLLVSTSVSVAVQAEVYRSVDADGNVTYSDTPNENSEVVGVTNPTIVPSFKGNTSFSSDDKDTGAETVPYQNIAITQPSNEQTIRDNVGNIAVAVSLTPSLQRGAGHRLQLLHNGAAVAEPGSAVRFTLTAVDRGAHTLQAVVVDRQGAVVNRSPVSQFFLHKTFVRSAP